MPGIPPASIGPVISQAAASRSKRRLRRSLWLALPVLGCGLLGGLGLVYVGVRAGQRSWWIAGVVYSAMSVGIFVALGAVDQSSAAATWGGFALLLTWFACICHCVVVNSGWLRWSAARAATSAQAPPFAGIGSSEPARLTAPVRDGPVKAFDRVTIALLTTSGVLGLGTIGFLVVLVNAAKGADPTGAGEALGFLSVAAIGPGCIAVVAFLTAIVRMVIRYNPRPYGPIPPRK